VRYLFSINRMASRLTHASIVLLAGQCRFLKIGEIDSRIVHDRSFDNYITLH
jgi:hypothetical protein